MALSRNTRIASAVVVLAIAAGGFLLLNRPEADAAVQSTDDAYVQADLTVVSPQIAGRIARVEVEDNQAVKAGALLATIDDRDSRVAVDAARAQVGAAQAAVQGLQAQIARQASARRQARAAVAADDAGLVLARADRSRFRNLVADGSGTLQALQQAEAQLHIHEATRQKDQAALESVDQQTEVLRAELQKARAGLAQAEAALAAAELNLSYTRIVAPVDGTVAQRSLRLGAYVGTGTPLLVLVPLERVYVEANFRETQLARVRPGQSVEIRVDGLPGTVLKGRVESLGPASGVSFSALPPHNATGNFTKIVQRLPVRISVDPGQPAASRLRVGMSVQPRIDTTGAQRET
ncbi:HlyD family secretion protein [Stenotrophomonas sp. MMGLT7]|uniref:HlyD family secretion protein n=1 Tax=Stenotrophomonas sp. MMGLT7 TaxID=2901227 RepID=UPI001E4DD57A|nr:HlyD family secretion protein [Stenotrophomonas sp. MMGLT7]MCD7096844.1 HlyD family secretion protein [Stenotrophomonas sp. MMGLT7]